MLIYKIIATLILIAGIVLGYLCGERGKKGDGVFSAVFGLLVSGLALLILNTIWLTPFSL
jgi:predicted Co/Zn/Cd cation transporter (cation efflux family)